jgi:lysophospholipase L1-like esterase
VESRSTSSTVTGTLLPANRCRQVIAWCLLLMPALLLAGSCVALHGQETVTVKRVLFIGNSLTAANDLPAMTRVLAESLPNLRIHVEAVTLPGASLEDHWNDGRAVRKIKQAHWDFVVLQQGPSSLPESRVHLVRWSQRFATVIRDSGGRIALFMVWPPKANGGAFDAVRDSYREAAEKTNGIFFPAGDAWRAAWRQNPELALYGPDGFHPSTQGSYLAALVIVGTLCDCSVRALPYQSLGVPRSAARALKQAADEVVLRHRGR